ncbi:hypothetical protein WFJ45_24170, partial [Salmonella enterica subsp. enterica serovar Minnesota]|uniref:hypothetical protein n=1 Tax=Salmonella enterica TaxID=28901 RepID=UPI003D2B4EC5
RVLTPCRAGIVYVGPCGGPAVTSRLLAGGVDVTVAADVTLTTSQQVCVGIGGQADVVVSLLRWQRPAP